MASDCWFCKLRQAEPAAARKVKMDYYREYSGGSDFKTETLGIPRCMQCKRRHAAVKWTTGLLWIPAIAVALLGASILIEGPEPQSGGPISFLILPRKAVGPVLLLGIPLLLVIGLPILTVILGSLVAHVLFLRRVLPDAGFAKHPDVASRIVQGWRIVD